MAKILRQINSRLSKIGFGMRTHAIETHPFLYSNRRLTKQCYHLKLIGAHYFSVIQEQRDFLAPNNEMNSIVIKHGKRLIIQILQFKLNSVYNISMIVYSGMCLTIINNLDVII